MAVATEECVHHWMIETPVGKFSKGVCKKCSAERSFASWGRSDCQRCGGLVTNKYHTCRGEKKVRK